MSDTGKPEYGEYHEPEYGANASQYGANYNPYIYGAPDPEPTAEQAAASAPPYAQPYGAPPAQSQTTPGQQGRPSQYGGQNDPYTGAPMQGQPGQQWQQGWQGQQQGAPAHTPHYFNGIDLNDPAQNPMYGHWDAYAVISLILALFFPVPVLSALMGALAMWRCRTFHMKGFWLGLAAVVINALYTIAVVWMMMNGIDAMSLYQQMLNQLQGGSSGTDTTITA
ncbi:hypothetical protein BLEM_0905 [Bifidobacterium lemurum]|uniref:DUF4190 domain-containing protein n=1 Tax=Bifidobacterium lemurum TaxID=1603886 RepID=A0A261FT78_9BIFI|nr:hypothetical protein [Bifidobacterium lemurum]OZG62359.1 hypothetical protein BLEM_0905 [Bifidobacterium lemurum]QOL33719.1 hypothetical protein BL8807_07960 [Bifidobacterium lemurum]